MLRLDHEARSRILAHCREDLPNEACGLLLGRGRRVVEAAPAGNVAIGDRRTRFELDPRDFVAADGRARDRGLEILGCYHSHPDRGASPSQADRAAGQEGWLQLIVGWPGEQDAELRCWLHSDGRWQEQALARPSPRRRERAESLRGYFDVQLRFAEQVATLSSSPLAEVALTHANFHRRFGLGSAEDGAVSPAWESYARALTACRDHAERLELSVERHANAAPGAPAPDERLFGCFSYTPPDPEGRVRLHFMNRDSADGVGPLASSKVSRRRRELASLIRSLAEDHPDARSIRGSSWLYHRESYRRLFPSCYTASARVIERGLRFSGSSSWGQFLRHDGVDEALCARFLRDLPELDLAAPWRVFPFPALRTSASLDAFRLELGVG